ncbi:MAG: adenosine deaminase [Spirochaetales bacterium]|nr:adenosine deaminase [Spirochaetales bacterium]
MKNIAETIEKMPKAELHVHLEGAVQPETLLELGERNKVSLPASDVDGLLKWYNFEDFHKFIEVYMKICECISTADDVFTVAWEFFQGQKKQNIIYTEVTWTAYTHMLQHELSFDAQAEALYAAADKAAKELGVRGLYVFDIPRQVSASEGIVTAKWLAKNYNPDYIAAIGMGGPEVGFPPERHARAFKITGAKGIPAVPHAGETEGPLSVRGALKLPGTIRLGHGVRAAEDPLLLEELKERDIVLEVCPSSNICLKVFPDLPHHNLPVLLDAGLKVTINSDDPPMFSTDLTSEYHKITETFGYGAQQLKTFNENAIEAALCSEDVRTELKRKFETEWKDITDEPD